MTVISERGRIGSLITAFTLFTTPFVVAITKQFPLPVQLVLSILLVLATTIKTTSPPSAPPREVQQRTNVLAGTRQFFLYFLPWVLLCLNNAIFVQTISTQLNEQFLGLQMTAFFLQYLSAGLGTLLCGLVIDWIGRRCMALLSFTMLGITTCISGLVPTPSLYLLFHLTSGFGWGSLLVLFLLIAWGEVAPSQLSGITYGLGLSAYHLTYGFGILLAPLSLQIGDAALLNAILMFLNVTLIYGAQNLIPIEVKERLYFELYLCQAKKDVI
jgi:MFS family permease